MRSVRTWFQFKPNAFKKITFKVLTPVCNVSNRVVFQIIVFREKIQLLIHNSIADISHRRQDLERDLVECIWLELTPSTNAPNIFFIQKPFCSYEWFDNFVQMIDNIHTVKPYADILVLGDFNIDLLKPCGTLL